MRFLVLALLALSAGCRTLGHLAGAAQPTTIQPEPGTKAYRIRGGAQDGALIVPEPGTKPGTYRVVGP